MHRAEWNFSNACFSNVLEGFCSIVLGLELLAYNFLSATTDQEMPKEDELHKESTCRRRFSLDVAVLVDSSSVYSLARNY